MPVKQAHPQIPVPPENSSPLIILVNSGSLAEDEVAYPWRITSSDEKGAGQILFP